MAAELVSRCPVDESVVWQGNEADESQVDEAFVSARQACWTMVGLHAGSEN